MTARAAVRMSWSSCRRERSLARTSPGLSSGGTCVSLAKVLGVGANRDEDAMDRAIDSRVIFCGVPGLKLQLFVICIVFLVSSIFMLVRLT
jgi:hypothetical protein